MSRDRNRFGALLLVAGIAACGGDSASPAPTGTGLPAAPAAVAALAIGTPLDTLDIGQTGRLSATPTDGAGRPISSLPVTWSGSADDVAQVAADGTVTAVAGGQVVATASAGGRTASVVVHVRRGAEERAAVVEAWPRALALAPGDAHPLAVVARDAAGVAVGAVRPRFSSTDSTVARVDADGRTVALRPGTATIVVAVGAATAAVPVQVEAPAPGAFALTLRLADRAADLGDVVSRAAARWERVVEADLPDAELSLPAGTCGAGVPAIRETVDDLLLVVRVDALDGEGGALATAGACVVRRDGGLPAVGVIRLDEADLPALRATGLLDDVLSHEIGHVLGIGTAWREGGRALVQDAPGGPAYLGAHARHAASALGFTSGAEAPVPLEDDGGAGTRGLHWRESVFARELMTGWLDDAAALSAVTVAALRDLGYGVRSTGADAFSSVLAGSVAPLIGSLRADDARPRLHDVVTAPVVWID